MADGDLRNCLIDAGVEHIEMNSGEYILTQHHRGRRAKYSASRDRLGLFPVSIGVNCAFG
eukprot:scaffold61018_cov52-Cyclotella_meneghiniana.AAC.2